MLVIKLLKRSCQQTVRQWLVASRAFFYQLQSKSKMSKKSDCRQDGLRLCASGDWDSTAHHHSVTSSSQVFKGLGLPEAHMQLLTLSGGPSVDSLKPDPV